jgi:hypothetical protein
MGCRYCGMHGERCLSSDEAGHCDNRSNNIANWPSGGATRREIAVVMAEIGRVLDDEYGVVLMEHIRQRLAGAMIDALEKHRGEEDAYRQGIRILARSGR